MQTPKLERPTKHMKVVNGPSKEVSFCKSNLQMVKKNVYNASVRFQLKVSNIAGIPDNVVLMGRCESRALDEQCYSVTAVEDGHVLRPCEVNQIQSLSPESLDEIILSMYIWSDNWKVSEIIGLMG